MRILGIHTHNFSFLAKQEASSQAEDLAGKPKEWSIDEECLVIFTNWLGMYGNVQSN